MSKQHRYILNWYHKNILHTDMDRMEVMILQHLYWTILIQAVYELFDSCETCQHTKRPNKKYIANYQLRSMKEHHRLFYVYLIGTSTICRKVKKKICNSTIRYHYWSHYKVIQNNRIWQQTRDNNLKISLIDVAN